VRRKLPTFLYKHFDHLVKRQHSDKINRIFNDAGKLSYLNPLGDLHEHEARALVR
jgi:hypothetical protein